MTKLFAWAGRIAFGTATLGAVATCVLFYLAPSVNDAWKIAGSKRGATSASRLDQYPPRKFVDALVATEDKRFFWIINRGIDPVAIGRVIFELSSGYRGDPGGSTITQQLAKMLYTPNRRDWYAEIEQLVLAVKLSLVYSKLEILTMYSDVAYFGDGNYGVRAASCGYFGKPPADLTWREAAMLAGVVNAPSADDPRIHPERARKREAHVFNRLVAVGVLTRAEVDRILNDPLRLAPKRGCEIQQISAF